jgi:hypothetical protein
VIGWYSAMIVSTSIATRGSRRVSRSTVRSSAARSGAVRNAHAPPVLTRITPRSAQCRSNAANASSGSRSSGSNGRSARHVTGSGLAKMNASARRRSRSGISGAAMPHLAPWAPIPASRDAGKSRQVPLSAAFNAKMQPLRQIDTAPG